MDMFRVHKRCENVLRELSSYVWDEKAQERGEDKPIKAHDHTLDAIRYVVNSTAKLWRDIMKGVS
jgi:phage terminase large subunit